MKKDKLPLAGHRKKDRKKRGMSSSRNSQSTNDHFTDNYGAAKDSSGNVHLG